MQKKTKPNPYDSVEKYSKQIEKVVQRMMYGIICYLHVTKLTHGTVWNKIPHVSMKRKGYCPSTIRKRANDRERRIASQIQILEKNVRDLEEQLHNAYKRINNYHSRR